MSNYLKATTTIITRKLKSGKSSHEKNLCSLFIRVRFIGRTNEWALGIKINHDDFKRIIDGNRLSSELREIKNLLNIHLLKADKICMLLGKEFTYEKFKEAFFNKSTVLNANKTIQGIISEYCSHKPMSIKTKKGYSTLNNHLSNYNKNLSLNDINSQFLIGFKSFLKSKNMTDPTIGVYFRYLKAIYNYSVEMKYVIKEQNPFKNFIIQNARNNKRALSKTTIQSLKDYKAECKNEEMARDFFIFSYLSNGMNFKDICLLKFNDIDKEIISFRRHKTINTAANIIKIQFLITEMHTSIIEKWGNIMTSEQNEDYLFPILNNCTNEIEIQQKIDQFIKRTNKYLARISKNIGLGFSISTIYARHSFATKLKNENIGQPIIKELMGHQDPNTTSSYFSEIGIENLRSIAALIALD